jgi:CheY-like chemotaxis protein/GAF domain-containing protein
LSDRPRYLVLGGADLTGADWLRRCGLYGEAVRVASWAEALELLRHESFNAVVANPADGPLFDALWSQYRAERILDSSPDGVAVVDFDLQVRWANPIFQEWCGGSAVGRGFYEALGSPEVAGPEFCPFHTALASLPPAARREGCGRDARAPGGAGVAPGGPLPPAPPDGQPGVTSRLHCRDDRYLELHITPFCEPDSPSPLLLARCRDISSLVQQQQKLDALHKAGKELAALAPEQLAEMSVPERVELLKQNIRKSIHDLLHYESIEIRLLDRQTGRLEPLLEDGMTPAATSRPLIASPEGHGVTGYVAATGESYLCPDTAADPLYIEGSPGAHSSLTVALVFQDRVIGTVNVESPRPNAFGEDDLQFAEIFSREIAAALNTLELLSAERSSSATASVEAVSREVALPVDDILAAATTVLERYIGHDPDMANQIRKIIAGARSIKAVIQKVGEDIPPGPLPSGPARPAPPPALKGLRVLVADNDDRVRRSAHSLLGRWGCTVETARDGREALTMARLGSYDAILADIRLPDISGYEVYRQLRAAQPQARVILMTAYGYDPSHALVKARQDGLRYVLYKPFRVDQLLAALSGPGPAPVVRPAGDGPAPDGPSRSPLSPDSRSASGRG